MSYKFKVFAGLVATGSIVGITMLPTGEKLSANLPNFKSSKEVKSSLMTNAISRKQKEAYSWHLVRPYTSGCTGKLEKNGISANTAKSVCTCSLEQMQAKHTQKQAIGILIKASKSKSIDSRTGMPAPLSGYFTPCMLGASK